MKFNKFVLGAALLVGSIAVATGLGVDNVVADTTTVTGHAAAKPSFSLSAEMLVKSATAHKIGTTQYGLSDLIGTTTLAGKKVTVNVLAAYNYKNGSGPFSGSVTVSFADGSVLGATLQGNTAKTGSKSTFTGTMGVIGGTGSYANETGNGIFTGVRNGSLVAGRQEVQKFTFYLSK